MDQLTVLTERYAYLQTLKFDITKPLPNVCWDTFVFESDREIADGRVTLDITKNVELWATIAEFDRYQVSTGGRVRSRATGELLELQTRGGYKSVSLYKTGNDRKRYSRSVH